MLLSGPQSGQSGLGGGGGRVGRIDLATRRLEHLTIVWYMTIIQVDKQGQRGDKPTSICTGREFDIKPAHLEYIVMTNQLHKNHGNTYISEEQQTMRSKRIPHSRL